MAGLLPLAVAPASAEIAACGPPGNAFAVGEEPPTDAAMRAERAAVIDRIHADTRSLAAENVQLMADWADRRGVYVVLTYFPCPAGRRPAAYRAYAQSVFDDRYGDGVVVVGPYSMPPAHLD